MTMLPAQRLREVLSYDPKSGIFRWRVDSSRARIGAVAGGVHPYGRRIRIDGRSYFADRLAFLYMTNVLPKTAIKHRDGDLFNDAWRNLRETPHKRRLYRNSRSGIHGVVKRDDGRFNARTINGVHLGCYATAEEAAACCVAVRLSGFG